MLYDNKKFFAYLYTKDSVGKEFVFYGELNPNEFINKLYNFKKKNIYYHSIRNINYEEIITGYNKGNDILIALITYDFACYLNTSKRYKTLEYFFNLYPEFFNIENYNKHIRIQKIKSII